MKNVFPYKKVTIFHDSGDFVAPAQDVFNEFDECHDQFVSLAPLRKEQCAALQPADLMAYEGLRIFDRRFQGDDAIRKSLQKIAGRVPITRGYIKRGAFQEIMRLKSKHKGETT